MNTSLINSTLLRELRGLISALCDDRLGEGQERRLVELLESDATAQQVFIESMNLETSLQYWCGIEGFLQEIAPSDGCDNGDRALVCESPRLPNISSFAWFSGLCALAVMLACMAFGWWLGSGAADWAGPPGAAGDALAVVPERGAAELPGATPFSDPLANLDPHSRRFRIPQSDSGAGFENAFAVCGRVVRFSPESEWSGDDLAIMQGTYLRPGQWLTLHRGVAEIHFLAGGKAILQGPATFQINGADAGYLHEGKLTAMVQGDSPGLTVRTPSSWCRVSEGRIGTTVDKTGVAEVQVLSGTVTAGLVNHGGTVIHPCNYVKGNAVRFNASTELLARIAFVADDYVLSIPETFIAYQNLAGMDGNQYDFHGSLGMDFVVKDPIAITKLGVFDSKGDGLNCTITAQLWMRDEAGTPYHFHDDQPIEKLIEMKFTPDDPGKLIESNRFKSLKEPLKLVPGAYTIVAYGYGEDEPNGNEGFVLFDEATGKNVMVVPKTPGTPKPLQSEHGDDIPTNALKRLDDGGGVILFVGSSRFDFKVGGFPRYLDSGSVNRYRAGTFEFERIPWEDVGEPNPWLPPRDKRDPRSSSYDSI